MKYFLSISVFFYHFSLFKIYRPYFFLTKVSAACFTCLISLSFAWIIIFFLPIFSMAHCNFLLLTFRSLLIFETRSVNSSLSSKVTLVLRSALVRSSLWAYFCLEYLTLLCLLCLHFEHWVLAFNWNFMMLKDSHPLQQTNSLLLPKSNLS